MSMLIRRALVVGCLLLMAWPVLAQDEVKIGILAYRPAQQTQAQWAPLAAALNKAIPGYQFVVEAYPFDKLTSAVAARQVDFVLTNPGHYVLMAKRYGLSAPLATMVSLEQGKPVTSFGGVIFTLAERSDMSRLEDVRGKSVAITSVDSLGGYQMQAYELARAGLRLPQDVRLVLTGMPHDRVVDEVLAGRADVGFVRSGVLEGLVREGKLDLFRIKVLNRQNLPGFPVQTSTRLYPEWPIAALPHTDDNLKRKFSAFLLTAADADKPLMSSLQIHGFDVPSDYSSVESVLRELRMPPFDVIPSFTIRDVWERYRWFVVVGLAGSGLLLVLWLRLLLANRHLKAERRVVLAQTEHLKESELRFRTVANYTHDWEYWHGPEHQIYYMSPSCERITGYTREEFTADPGLLERITQPEDRPLLADHLHSSLQLKDSEQVDFRIIRRDGSMRWIAHACQAVYDDEGEYNGRRVSNRDITDRKQAEDLLRMMQFSVDHAGDSIFWIDREGRMLYVNDAACAERGYSREELLGMRIFDLDPDYQPGVWGPHFENLKRHGTLTLETRHRTKDGQIYPVEVNANYVHIGDQEINFASLRDITNRRNVEDALLQAKESAESLAKSKAEFLANMSHEIRTPMNAIIGLSHLALNKKVSKEVRDYLEKINISSESLLGILNEILDFSKMEAGKLAIEKRRFSLFQIDNSLTNLFSTQAKEKHLKFHIDVATGIPIDLIGDAFRIQQVLSNLIGNAIKFTDNGKVTLKVSLLAIEESQAKVRFSVLDTGIGISQDDQAKLFQPFSQADGSITRRFGGTGLGLVISHRLLQLMGSDLHVESAFGKGSTFSFDLLLGVASRELHEEVDRRHAERTAGTLANDLREQGQVLKGSRILLAEDNAINQQVVKEFLQLSGVTVDIANNGQEAMQRLEQNTYDAVLMDIHMPVMGGVEATEHVRRQPQFASLPVIALTAGVTQEERDKCQACGMNDFIAKPVSPAELIAVLCHWVGKNKSPASETNSLATTESLPAEQPPSLDTLPGFDLVNLLVMVGGNKELATKLLRTFRDDYADAIAKLDMQLNAQDFGAAESMIHTIKGAAGNLGALELHAAASALDASLKQGELDQAALDNFKKALAATSSSLLRL